MKEEDYENPLDDFVSNLDIHSLLPQQEPFIMVDQLKHFDMKRIVTSTKIYSDNIFVKSNKMSPSGLIENMAQTCAARIGYINKYILKKGIQIGFIGAVRDFVVHQLPKVDDVIYTEIDVQEEVFGMILVSASIKTTESVCATAELKIAIKE
ncbi:MAG: pseudouridylate synthase [Bacteroidaceae bacterium]|nr:pseudouridylate synthase [Bacteroidaceae bacterium]